ncbi:hypothetical protein [uncultured Microbulbifer sp.]|uniref:hypothetical protein n=1 Tax=uncultured Microbulbifer sp. TaxID=348147 RepID=UPI00262F4C0C|nr:hypothetical protein [uncultured Microbulbifer sp.]
MRGLILTLIICCFAAQSLALVVSPGCDMGMMTETAHDHGQNMDHGSSSHMAMSQSDMPCCDTGVDIGTDGYAGQSPAADLCQLTCASGGCSVAMATENLLFQPVLNSAPYLAQSPSPLPASQQNLLRPPIGA